MAVEAVRNSQSGSSLRGTSLSPGNSMGSNGPVAYSPNCSPASRLGHSGRSTCNLHYQAINNHIESPTCSQPSSQPDLVLSMPPVHLAGHQIHHLRFGSDAVHRDAGRSIRHQASIAKPGLRRMRGIRGRPSSTYQSKLMGPAHAQLGT